MPWRKRLLVAVAVAAGAALLVIGGIAIARGHLGAGVALVAAVCVAFALVLDACWVKLDLSGASLRRGRRDSKLVALTFDDGPGPDTPAVLDALDAVGVRATFFMLGEAAAARPDLVREVARRGHLVAQHGHSHRKLHLAFSGTIARELEQGRHAILGAGVEPAPFFRAPHGLKGPLLRRELRRHGLTLVGWTRGVWDTERPGTAAIVERACRRMRGGEILLLHDGCGTGGIDPRRDEGAAAIPGIVGRWRRAGYQFVTVDRMADRARPALPWVPENYGQRADSTRPDIEPNPMLTPVLTRVPEKRPTLPTGGRMSGSVVGSLSVSGGALPIFSEISVPENVSRALRWLVVAAIVALTLLAARKLNPDEIHRAFAEAKPTLLFAAAVGNVLTLMLQTGRWLAIVRPIEPRARPRDAFFSLAAGYAIGIVVPARASDLARAHLMARRSGASMATLTATAVVDHVIGSVALLAMLGVFAASSALPFWLRSAGTLASVVAVGALTTLWILRPRDLRKVEQGGLAGMTARLRQGLAAIGRPRALAVSCVFAVGGWACEIFIAHLSLLAFGLPAGLQPSLLCVLATTLSAAASVAPGNAGAFEIACVVALSGFGVGREPALAFAIGYHAAHLIPTATMGGAWLLAHGYRVTPVHGSP